MRSILIALGLMSASPSFAVAQDNPTCTTLVVIQNEGCSVRRVFTCDNMPEDVRNVGNYGLAGPTLVVSVNTDGRTLRISAGPDTPTITLGEQADPFSLRVALAEGADSFNYQMVHETAGPATVSGQITTSGEMVTIDGQTMQIFQSDQTTLTPEGETQVADVRYLYHATLQLLLTASTNDATTGQVRVERTPVDFIWPGEAGFEDYTPLYGCES
jgi:hypothetical protein